jgi:uncharacterized protein (TIGR02118 family)
VIRVTILYPHADGTRFDLSYYTRRHMPLVAERLKSFGLTGTEVERGINASIAGTPPPFHCIGHLLFGNPEQYQAGMKAHGKELAADIVNFTNAKPIIQVSEILG